MGNGEPDKKAKAVGFLRIGTFGGVSGQVTSGRYLWKEGRDGG